LSNCVDKLSFCFANSFVLNISKLVDFLEFTKNIKTDCKMHSECTERILAGILYVLNNNVNASVEKIKIDDVLHLFAETLNNKGFFEFNYFRKYLSNKTELTEDKCC
jgi:hypothetical protein